MSGIRFTRWIPRCCFILVLFAFVGTGELTAAPPAPGKLLSAQFTINGRPHVFKFRYCPEGQVRPGNPAENLPVQDVQSFYMSETEVSQETFSFFVPKDTVQKIRNGVSNTLGDQVVTCLKQPPTQHPMLFLSLRDAADFCLILNNYPLALSVPGQANAPAASILHPRFRLPNHIEWQYACRGFTKPEEAVAAGHVHFSYWGGKLGDVAFDFWQERWKALHPETAGFTDDQFKQIKGTQPEVIELVERIETSPRPKQDYLTVLNHFLKPEDGHHVIPNDFQRIYSPGGGGGQASENVPFRMVEKLAANRWNLRGMHGNAAEWTIVSQNPSETDQWWRWLAKPGEFADQLENTKYLAAGGSCLNLGNNGKWVMFTTWGGSEPMPYSQAANPKARNNPPQSKYAGIRVLMYFDVREDWLQVVENAVLDANPAAIQAVHEEFERLDGGVRKRLEPSLNLYEASLYARKGDAAKAKDLATTAATQANKQDLDHKEYFGLVSELMKRDARDMP